MPIIGTPVPVVQAVATGEGQELGAYQIPDMSCPAASAPAPPPTKVTSIPEPPANYDSPQWSHPERLQRSRWRESLGEPTTIPRIPPGESSGSLGTKAN